MPEKADPAEIKRAYRRLARKLHPDVNPGKKSVTEMSDVNEAYRILGDESRRASYDAERNQRISGAPSVDREWTGGIYVRPHLAIVDLPSPIEAIEFVGTRQEVALAGFDNMIRFCSAANGNTLGEVRLEGSAASYLQWCGKLGLFAGGSSEKSASIWQIKARQVVKAHRKRVDWISRVAISPTGNIAVLVSAHKTALVMDAQSGDTLFVRRKHEDAVTAVAISPEGKLFATGGNDQKVIIWDAASGNERAVLAQRAAVTNLRFSKDGSMLAVVLVDQGTRVHELATGNLRTTVWGHEKPVEDVDFHPDNNYLATASRDSTVGLWSLSDGSLKHRLHPHKSAARCVRFSADGGTLASGGSDRRVSIHRVITG